MSLTRCGQLHAMDAGVVAGRNAGQPVGRFHGGLHGGDAAARAESPVVPPPSVLRVVCINHLPRPWPPAADTPLRRHGSVDHLSSACPACIWNRKREQTKKIKEMEEELAKTDRMIRLATPALSLDAAQSKQAGAPAHSTHATPRAHTHRRHLRQRHLRERHRNHPSLFRTGRI